jgi:ABC-type antimicrobial peptide transport system permease subunit
VSVTDHEGREAHEDGTKLRNRTTSQKRMSPVSDPGDLAVEAAALFAVPVAILLLISVNTAGRRRGAATAGAVEPRGAGREPARCRRRRVFGAPLLVASQGEIPGVDSWDPIAIGGGVIALGSAACLVAIGPAYRASRVDPVEALRAE